MNHPKDYFDHTYFSVSCKYIQQKKQFIACCYLELIPPAETVIVNSDNLNFRKNSKNIFIIEKLVIMQPEKFGIKNILINGKHQFTNDVELFPATMLHNTQLEVMNTLCENDILSIIVTNLTNENQVFRSTFFGMLQEDHYN